ncbi:hypothetical protein RN001_009377 [Aquatica leii]|uniref:Uncharacterized protein n=1 Tax=Aquatica leii TaxID=1421715 RepID=A0AAN7S849_9COLE|nr:hypothetical protein RN001_009377 [Aquatica leii]
MKSILVCVIVSAISTIALPISQPLVHNPYVNTQQIQPVQFAPRLQQPQVQYIQQVLQQTPAEIYQGLSQRHSTPPPPPPPPPSPPAQITQLLLPSAVDRQVQQAAAYVAGPQYAREVQSLQLQGLADQAQAIALRRAQLTSLRLKQVQPQYQQQLSQSKPNRNQPQLSQDDNPQLPEDYDPNPSYQFGFDVKDDYYTNYQNRKEQRDGNKISGSYSVVDADGFLRTVTYTADPKEGFKAEVNRQPTNIVVKIPKPTLSPKQQYLQEADDAQVDAPKQRLIYQYQ